MSKQSQKEHYAGDEQGTRVSGLHRRRLFLDANSHKKEQNSWIPGHPWAHSLMGTFGGENVPSMYIVSRSDYSMVPL